jgi:hypothetical protein
MAQMARTSGKSSSSGRTTNTDEPTRQARRAPERVLPAWHSSQGVRDRLPRHDRQAAVGGRAQKLFSVTVAVGTIATNKHHASRVGAPVGEDLAAPPRLVPPPPEPPRPESPADGQHERGADDGDRNRPRVSRQVAEPSGDVPARCDRDDDDRCDDAPRPSTAGARSVSEAQRTPGARPLPALS